MYQGCAAGTCNSNKIAIWLYTHEKCSGDMFQGDVEVTSLLCEWAHHLESVSFWKQPECVGQQINTNNDSIKV